MRTAESTVAIVGAGAAGVLTALRLLAVATRTGRRIDPVLVDPAGEIGHGTAFRTHEPAHLLNTPAGKLGADPADPGGFARWCGETLGRPVGPEEFLPRRLFGDYLGALLDVTARRGGAHLDYVRERVVRLTRSGPGVTLELASGSQFTASAAVLAVGAGAPDTGWAPRALRESPRFVADPWARGLTAPGDEDVLFVGTGLTMTDLAVQLDRPHRTMYAVSRTGLLPRVHALRPGTPAAAPDLSGLDLDEVWRAVSAGRGWRAAVDRLRPVVPEIWRGLSPAEQRRFLDEKARYWNVLRHRMPPAVADRLRRIRRDGRLRLYTGEVTGAVEDRAGLCVELSGGRVLRAGLVVNCTGPNPDPRSGGRLVPGLFEDGLAMPGPHGLGIDTAADGRVLARTGPHAPLWTLGAPRVGGLWESTAIPEIRDQAGTLAAAVLAHVAVPAAVTA
ncbi:FAD/NAD(P)-binding protein [Amycolatopsis samaneae]|uniref:FAD/NAD(P)-binding protein n=1 Tax=Amycolatopsis samaneae TaxID=664691 RepID=A0ABW5GRT7_9PSEU